MYVPQESLAAAIARDRQHEARRHRQAALLRKHRTSYWSRLGTWMRSSRTVRRVGVRHLAAG